jgi:hypothetical protein
VEIDLGFDLYAMAKPKSRADLLLLADEARAELKRINDHFDRMFADCGNPVTE